MRWAACPEFLVERAIFSAQFDSFSRNVLNLHQDHDVEQTWERYLAARRHGIGKSKNLVPVVNYQNRSPAEAKPRLSIICNRASVSERCEASDFS